MLSRAGAAYGLLRHVGFDGRLVLDNEGKELPWIVDATMVALEESWGFPNLIGPVVPGIPAGSPPMTGQIMVSPTGMVVSFDRGLAGVNSYYWPKVDAFDPLKSVQFMLDLYYADGSFKAWTSWKTLRYRSKRKYADVVHGSWNLPPKWQTAQTNPVRLVP